jgi:cystathionine beta-lyase family protein involved in aluminum resistance
MGKRHPFTQPIDKQHLHGKKTVMQDPWTSTKYGREQSEARQLFSALPVQAKELDDQTPVHHTIQEVVQLVQRGFSVTDQMAQGILALQRPQNTVASTIQRTNRDQYILGLHLIGAAETFADGETIEKVCREAAMRLRRAYVENGLTFEPISDGLRKTSDQLVQAGR